jgi:hypothetical protein
MPQRPSESTDYALVRIPYLKVIFAAEFIIVIPPAKGEFRSNGFSDIQAYNKYYLIKTYSYIKL